ncbi:MAG TPA: class II aldolase/adducin family protein [Chloroflexota bacterium]|nr:class II aldolase/adducin family protein [Chloroflexota bacterium]
MNHWFEERTGAGNASGHQLRETMSDLLWLARSLASAPRMYAILGEGNVSVRLDDHELLIKASGTMLARSTEQGMVRVDLARAHALTDPALTTDELVGAALRATLLDTGATARPSVETAVHAVLIAEAGARWVAHTHPPTMLGVLCSERAEALAAGSLFPDQIVICGPNPLFLPYHDPGVPLARALQAALATHMSAHGGPPKAIYLANHGFIALGHSSAEVLAITDMAVKAAAALTLAFASGGPRYLPEAEARRITERADEHYRQGVLGLAPLTGAS